MRKNYSNTNIIWENENSLINEDYVLSLNNNYYYLRFIDGDEKYLSEYSMCNDEY